MSKDVKSSLSESMDNITNNIENTYNDVRFTALDAVSII